MCKLKSLIVLKDRIYCPDHNHHTQMLEELGIDDNRINAKSVFVRVELSPQNDDVFSDIETWRLKVDQDMRPDWFFEEVEKPKVIEAVKTWAKNCIFVGLDNLEINIWGNEIRNIYLKDCKNAKIQSYGASTANVESCGTPIVNVESYGTSISIVKSYDTSTAIVKSCDTSTANVTSYDTSTAIVESYDTSTANVTSCDTSTANVESYGTSTANVESYGTSTANVESYGTSTVKKLYKSGGSKFTFVLKDNSTLKDHCEKKIYQSGDWELFLVGGHNA